MCCVLAVQLNCNFFGGGFPCCPEASSSGILCLRERSERWDIEEWDTIIGIENRHRGRRAKKDNEKKSENVSCTLLHCSQGPSVLNVSFHSCVVKSMSSRTDFALGITCPVVLHMYQVLQLPCYVTAWF